MTYKNLSNIKTKILKNPFIPVLQAPGQNLPDEAGLPPLPPLSQGSPLGWDSRQGIWWTPARASGASLHSVSPAKGPAREHRPLGPTGRDLKPPLSRKKPGRLHTHRHKFVVLQLDDVPNLNVQPPILLQPGRKHVLELLKIAWIVFRILKFCPQLWCLGWVSPDVLCSLCSQERGGTKWSGGNHATDPGSRWSHVQAAAAMAQKGMCYISSLAIRCAQGKGSR